MHARHTHRRRAIALVPASLLCTLLSAPMHGAAAPSADHVSASLHEPSVPTEAIEVPASLSRPGVVVRDGKGRFRGPTASPVVSASDVPGAALSAYHRAETVINAADKGCNISWQLIAAVGRVESDHGRVNGSSLDDKGRAVPGIFGIALDGSNSTTVIRDTDAGQYDGDRKWDRAVGPMQFIPSTWSVVGVDGDSNGKRNPQDMDDAALAAAVYLCSGNEDLSAEAGRRAAIFRYNHSHDYVDLVLSSMEAYLRFDFTSVPSTVSYADSFVLAPELARSKPSEASQRSAPARSVRDDAGPEDHAGARQGTGPGATGSDSGAEQPARDPGPEPTPEPKPAPEPEEAAPEPAPEPKTEAAPEPEAPTTPEPPPAPEPAPEPAPAPNPEPAPAPEPAPEPKPAPEPEPAALTEEESTEECLVVVGATDVGGLEQLGLLEDFTSCMAVRGFPQWSAP